MYTDYLDKLCNTNNTTVGYYFNQYNSKMERKTRMNNSLSNSKSVGYLPERYHLAVKLATLRAVNNLRTKLGAAGVAVNNLFLLAFPTLTEDSNHLTK